jgi:hypothetical protein
MQVEKKNEHRIMRASAEFYCNNSALCTSARWVLGLKCIKSCYYLANDGLMAVPWLMFRSVFCINNEKSRLCISERVSM